MGAVFTLFGELKAETRSFQNELRAAEDRLKSTERAIDQTEAKARSLGQTSATVGRQYEKLNENLNQHRQRLTQAADGYQRGTLTAKQMETALKGTDRATDGLNSRLRDSQARLTDYATRQGDVIANLKKVVPGMQQFGQSLTYGVTLPLLALGAASITSATSIDAMRNRLVAATGSVEAANKKMTELRTLAQGSAGVFTAAAVEMYAFLRPMQVGEETINTMIKALGRLKLANEELDPKRFAINLTQLYTQNFERMDLKEAVGAFPRFGEIMQKAFSLSGTDLDTVATEMKTKLASGMKKEDFFKAIADAIQNDSSLGLLADTVGIRFQKMMERVFVALEPLGKAILNIVEPIAQTLTPVIQQLSAAFTALGPGLQTAIALFGGLALAAGPLIIGVASIISAVTAIAGAVTALGGLATVAPVLALVGVAIAALAADAATLYLMWQTNFGGIRELTQMVASGVKFLWDDAMSHLKDLTQHVTEEITTFWAANGEDIKKAVHTSSEAIKAIWEKVAAYWRENGENIKAVTSAVWTAVGSIVMGVLKIVLEAIKGTAAVINGDWAKAFGSLDKIVRISFDLMVKAVVAGGVAILAAIKVAWNGIWALDGWIRSQAIRLGTALIEGMVAGIRSGAGAVANAAQSIATSAIIAARMALQIQSPSKVFFGIGTDVAQGFIDGIESMKTGVQAGMARMLDISNLKIKFGKGDAEGVSLLSSLIQELDQLTPRTKLEEMQAKLTGAAYEKLNKQIKDRILLGAYQIDLMRRMKAGMELSGEGTGEGSGRAAFDDGGEWSGLGPKPLSDKDQQKADLEEQKSLIDSINKVTKAIGPPPLQPWADFWGMLKARLMDFRNQLPSFKQAIGENLVAGIQNFAQSIGDAFANFNGNFKDLFHSIVQGFRQMVGQLIGEMVRMLMYKAIFALLGAFAGGGGGGKGGGGLGVTSWGFGQPAAEGGYRSGRLPYLVGERGPELFMPGVGGTVVSNANTRAMMAGGTTTNNQPIHVTVNAPGGNPATVRNSAYQGTMAALQMIEKQRNRNK